ncbi:MAG: hypothetical protein sL5_08070 [Candidatus Mesenet longicola]|uniref:Ankyrin repeat domain-containing protein n=1 Tax=Candidatus Mesenet longicola TaxID=1892558 RepID=A0A8J3HPT1_9RICK|nr:MAG: hypothetical protein sL5_08070 [Candidatus Mesenet longicola]
MKKGINVLKNAVLRKAVDDCNLQKVEEALKEATLDNINHRIYHNHQGWHYYSTLLDDAIVDQDCPDSIANTLIEHGADIRIKGEYGRTSLINAIIHKKDSIAQKIINVILSEGIKQKLPEESVDEYISKEISIKDNGGKSALHYSLYYERFEVTQTLLRYHAKVEKEDIELARSKDNQQIVKLLEMKFNAQLSTIRATTLNTTKPDIKSIMEQICNTNRSNGAFDLRNCTAENTAIADTNSTTILGSTTLILAMVNTAAAAMLGIVAQNTPNILTMFNGKSLPEFNQTDISPTQKDDSGSIAGIVTGILGAIVVGIVGCFVVKKCRSNHQEIEYDSVPSTLGQPQSEHTGQSSTSETSV